MNTIEASPQDPNKLLTKSVNMTKLMPQMSQIFWSVHRKFLLMIMNAPDIGSTLVILTRVLFKFLPIHFTAHVHPNLRL